MRIAISPEAHHTSMIVPDEELVEAYRSGGMEAVLDVLVEYADDISEQPFYWPDKPHEQEILALVATSLADEQDANG